jgi:dihydroorotase
MMFLRPDDFHVHLRLDEMLKHVTKHTANVFARALVMPNTDPPILDADGVTEYREQILAAERDVKDFKPLMTVKITPATTPDIIAKAKEAGAIAGKVYPANVTTNSEDGARRFEDLYPCFDAMQKAGMVLSMHGEMPDVDTIDAESQFLLVLTRIAADFPSLKIVMEHVTTADAVDEILNLPDTVAATVTVHHLYLTMNDVCCGKLRPHNFCMPIAKRKRDREALRRVVLAGNRKFFLGTDSAPHLVTDKECAEGCAGVFTAPVAYPLLIQLFHEAGAEFRLLERFTSYNGAGHYGLELNNGSIVLHHQDWVVPQKYGEVVPFMAGKTIHWQVEEDWAY